MNDLLAAGIVAGLIILGAFLLMRRNAKKTGGGDARGPDRREQD